MNQYHIYEAIGRGKHSVVYKGRKKKTIQYCAIKSVEKSQKPRVLQEVKTLHSLNHDNVLKFYAWYETNNHLWLILEYCVGGDLKTLLQQDTRLPEESIHDFARDLVKALLFLHHNGVIYCDLKPSNVLLDENGRLKLCDFGLARKLGDIAKKSVQQLEKEKRGTPSYMAPELLKEGGVHSFSSDLWGLGCVMYECYAGRPPFYSSSLTQLVSSVLTEEPAPLPGKPTAHFQDLVLRLLAKNPANRIQWGDVLRHPFWRAQLPLLELPGQPAFEKYLQLHKQTDEEVGRSCETVDSTGQKHTSAERLAFEEAKHGSRSSDSLGRKEFPWGPLQEISINGEVNILRLSRAAKANLQREADGDGYRQVASAMQSAEIDVEIENHDLELNFAEGRDDMSTTTTEDEDDISSAGGTDMPLQAEDSAAVFSNSNTQSTRSTSSSDAETGKSSLPVHARRASLRGPTPADEEVKPAAEALQALHLEDSASGMTSVSVDALTDGTDSEQLQAEGGLQAGISVMQFLWHHSDQSVKPIMLNRRIEKPEPPRFHERLLPFPAYLPVEFTAQPQEELQAHVERIVSSIEASTSQSERLNTLGYLELLCADTEAANMLSGGALMPCLVQVLHAAKAPILREKLTYVIGLIIRHATDIHDWLAKTNIGKRPTNSGCFLINAVMELAKTLQDVDERVRQRGMASLGELLFFVATVTDGASSQPEAGQASAHIKGCWKVPDETVHSIQRLLNQGTDSLSQHYAVKTLENILSQGNGWVVRFASEGVVSNLVLLTRMGRPEHLRISAGSCLVRIVRSQPDWLSLVIKELSFGTVIAGLARGSVREQQVYISLLNAALAQGRGSSLSKQFVQLYNARELTPNISALWQHPSEVLRGKAIAAVLLLCRLDSRWLRAFCDAKLVQIVEHLFKDKDPFVRQSLRALVKEVTLSKEAFTTCKELQRLLRFRTS
eukprot:SM000131S26743  [mRNA]  locus=s131:273587:278222:+ [translate_table: standard]